MIKTNKTGVSLMFSETLILLMNLTFRSSVLQFLTPIQVFYMAKSLLFSYKAADYRHAQLKYLARTHTLKYKNQ